MKHTGRTPVLFLTVVLAALVCKLFILDLMYVSGPSMEPTFAPGSFIFEFKLAWGIPVPFTNSYALRWGEPKPGDIVIFPWKDRWVIKRCLATAGTPILFPEGTPRSMRIQGEILSLTEEQWRRLKDAERVPEGMIFAVGDNRRESLDSREYGFVSMDSIRGKVLWN